jgi:hypothetical protein
MAFQGKKCMNANFYESIDQSLSCYYICFRNENNHHYHCTIMLIKCKLLQCHNYNNNISNRHEKHKNYKNLVSMFIQGDMPFRVALERGSKAEKKNDIRKNK